MLAVRLALRSLQKVPGFAGASIVTLALGIGATTAIFSVAYGVLLRPLPYRDARSLVLIGSVSTFGGHRQPANFSGWELAEWRARTHRFDAIAGYALGDVALETEQTTLPLEAECVSSNFFDLVNGPMVLGRTLEPGDDHTAAAVISTSLWRHVFGGAADVIGRTITLNGAPVTIVGVARAGFRLPEPRTDLWLPLEYAKASGIAPWLRVARGGGLLMMARLAPGATLAEAQADVDAAQRTLVQDHRERQGAREITLTTVRDAASGSVRPALMVLMAAVSLSLLIACANVMHFCSRGNPVGHTKLRSARLSAQVVSASSRRRSQKRESSLAPAA